MKCCGMGWQAHSPRLSDAWFAEPGAGVPRRLHRECSVSGSPGITRRSNGGTRKTTPWTVRHEGAAVQRQQERTYAFLTEELACPSSGAAAGIRLR